MRLSRSPRPRASRSPRAVRSPRPLRSPRLIRSPRSPRARPRSRGSSRLRYSRSRSMSRGRIRRSPWSPRRRRTRERTLSLTREYVRSPSPRRRHRSPLRYRSPLRSPPRSLPRSPPRSPPHSPRRDHSPLPRPLSPHRYTGVYDELLSPPRRSVEPPYGARYGPRNNLPPPVFPPMGSKPPPLMASIALPPDQLPLPGFRSRYNATPFEEIPPGVEPPVPGFEPSPFEKPPFTPVGSIDRERLPPPNYREPFRPPPYAEGPNNYRDMPVPSGPNEIPVHVGEPPRYRDNFRQGHSYRDSGPMQFRDGQPYREPGPQGQPYREPNYRGGPPPFRDGPPYRNVPFRDGGFRDNPQHNFREGVPYRPPSADNRGEPIPPNFHDPNNREAFHDDAGGREQMRPGYRGMRNRSSRRHPNMEHERPRERDPRDRDRYIENRDPAERSERPRELDRRYDKSRELREGRDGREDRPRDYERSRDYDKERDQMTPEKKSRGSPKRSREIREKKRSESRGRSRDRDNRRDKKEEKIRDKSSDRSKDHKEKEKKLKDRKKKKREKDKEVDKKKKRDKKEKKDKDSVKKEDDEIDKSSLKDEENDGPKTINTDTHIQDKTDSIRVLKNNIKKEDSSKSNIEKPKKDDLYGDEAAEAVDKEIIQNYIKNNENEKISEPKNELGTKEEPFDGIELQATADELDLKIDTETNSNNKEVLAPLPQLSKWEVDDESAEKSKEPGEISSPEEEQDTSKVTSDVIKRAENAIFAKAINSLRPIEIKKISSDRLKLYGDEAPKPLNNIQITVPVTNTDQRSIEINDKKKRYSKTPPPKLSVKERLGGKVDDIRRGREPRVVHSTVERVKSRSKTPKKEQPYRRVTVERDRSRKQDSTIKHESSKLERRAVAEGKKHGDKYRDRSPIIDKKSDMNREEKKAPNQLKEESREKDQSKSGLPVSKTFNADRERKKSTLDEAHFEPDYDETVESESEAKDDSMKKRDRSLSPNAQENESKKAKLDETIKLDLTNVKKKPDTESDSTSDSDDSSSTSSSDARKRKKKKKRSSRKKKKRAASESESESESSSDDHKKKKKKRKHKKKSSKKKKKSKHK